MPQCGVGQALRKYNLGRSAGQALILVILAMPLFFAVCGLVGFGMMLVGNTINSRALSAASVALWGWVIVPVIVIPLLLLWRLFAWCRQRIAG